MNRAPYGYSYNLAKPSGKIQAFMIWVNEVARKKFKRHYGYDLDMKNQEHMTVLDDWYGQLTPEEKEYYKKKEKGEVNRPNNYLPRRHQEDGSRRDRMANGPEAYWEAKRRHRDNVHRLQDEMVRQQGPIHMPKAHNMFMSNPLYIEHFKTRREETKLHLTENYKFITKDRPADIVLNMKYAFIGATPACSTIVKENLGPRSTHIHLTLPLELSVVVFSLAEGILAKSTFHMNVDPEGVFSNVIEDYEERLRQRDRTQAAARKFGLSPDFTNRDQMTEAWFFVKRSVDENAKLVCDADNFNYVTGALHLLSYEAGLEEAHYNDQNFAKNLMAIQDLACVLRNITDKNIPDSTIDRFFEKNNLVPTDTYCRIHGAMQLDNARRLFCQEARAAMSIQKLIDFLRSEELHDMHGQFNAGMHALCTELVGTSTVPRMPKHPLMTAEDAQGARRLDKFMFSEDEDDDEGETIDAVLRQEMNQNFRGRPEPFRQEPYGYRQPSPPVMRAHPVVEPHFDEPPPPQLGSTTRAPPAAAPPRAPPPAAEPILNTGGFEKIHRFSIPAPFCFNWKAMTDEEFAKLPAWKEGTRQRL